MIKVFKIITNRNFLPILVVLIISILAARRLLFERGYFVMHDDLQMMRQLEMEKCFLDGQIPCRWVPDMGFGFGFPLFNYYPPLPYLVGEAFRIIGFSFVETIKLTFELSLILSGISMYFLAKEFFGKIGGVLASGFYVWAPYRAVDIFVRGAMNESWAFILFPLIFLFSYRLVTSDKFKVTSNVIFLSLSYSLLIMTHNIMVLIFTPVFIIWVFIWLWQSGKWTRLLDLVKSGLLAIGISAFFIIPVIFERKLVRIENLIGGYYDYAGHFASLRQLFVSRFWGYGGSIWGPNDGMSFQVGHLHWILSLVIGFSLFLYLLRKRNGWVKTFRTNNLLLITCYLILTGWFSIFLVHYKSYPIWKNIAILSYVQFPWRFLSIVVFSLSFLVGVIPGVFVSFKERKRLLSKLILTPPQILVTTFLLATLIFFNWNYFLPMNGAMGRITDGEKFSGVSWELQQGGGVTDYLPLAADRQPHAASGGIADVYSGDVEIKNALQGTYWVKLYAKVESDFGLVRINVFDYPNWRVFANNSRVDIFVPDDEEIGRIHFTLPQGEYLVYAQLFNTWPRTLGNLISLFTMGGLLVYLLRQNKLLHA